MGRLDKEITRKDFVIGHEHFQIGFKNVFYQMKSLSTIIQICIKCGAVICNVVLFIQVWIEAVLRT